MAGAFVGQVGNPNPIVNGRCWLFSSYKAIVFFFFFGQQSHTPAIGRQQTMSEAKDAPSEGSRKRRVKKDWSRKDR